MAFEIRFVITCAMRWSSISASGMSSGVSILRFSSRSSNRRCRFSAACRITATRSPGSSVMGRVAFSSFEKSRMSLMSRSSRCEFVAAARRNCAWRGSSFQKRSSDRSSRLPMTTVMGVRSSCDTMATNSDFRRSSSSVFS